MSEWTGWSMLGVGGFVCALNAYLSWLRPRLHFLRGGSRAEYRHASGVPLLGSLMVLVGAALVARTHDSTALLVGAAVLIAIDAGGPQWLLVAVARSWAERSDARRPLGPVPAGVWQALPDGRRGRAAWAGRLGRPFGFRSPFRGRSFAALVSVHASDVTPEEQAALSAALVEQGCRYAVCTGHACSSWDDSIDMAYLATDPDHDPPDETFVMTTWHANQSIEEVAGFFVHTARFEGFEPRRLLVLCIGDDADGYARVRDAVAAELLRAGDA